MDKSVRISQRARRWLGVAMGLIGAWLSPWAHADYMALKALHATGNTTFTSALGMDFDVLKPITVTQLGAYDSGQAGFANTVHVAIYNRNTEAIVTGLSTDLTTANSTLNGYSRFKAITPVTLPAGNYSIVASGLDKHYQGSYGSPDTSLIDHGGNLIRFVNNSRYDGWWLIHGTSLYWPNIGDVGPSVRFSAGTFMYTEATAATAFPGGVRGPVAWWRSSAVSASDGGSVSSWTNTADSTRNLSVVTTAPLYRNNNSYNINFNPLVEYSNYLHSLKTSSLASTSPHAQAHTFYVGYPTATSELAETFKEDIYLWYWELYLPYNGKIQYDAGPSALGDRVSVTPLSTSGLPGFQNVPNIFLMHKDAINATSPDSYEGVRQNGVALTPTYGDSDATTDMFAGQGYDFYLGYGTFSGRIGELLVYTDTQLTARRTTQIETYLGIKYGITLGGNGASSYAYIGADDGADTGGSTVWTAGTGYHYNVTGIAREDFSLLDQRISRSANTGTQITVASGSTMPTGASVVTPTSATAFTSDQTYLIWGDNNGTATSTATISSGTYSGVARSARIWRAQTTNGGPTNVTVCIPDSLWPSGYTSNARLLMAADAAFTTSITNVAMSSGTCPGSGLGVTASVAGRVATVTSAQLASSGGVGYFTLVNVNGASLHHVAITTATGTTSGLTCTPTTFTITACADASCSTAYTGGLTGTMTLVGSGGTINFITGPSFTIASGDSSATISAQVTTAGYVTAGVTSLSVTPTYSAYCGMGIAAASGNNCQLPIASAGLVLSSVPNHVSNVAQSMTVSALKASDTSKACVPAFVGSKAITFACSYTNPSSGTLPVLVGGTAVNSSGSSTAACDSSGKAVSLTFNSSGVATTTVQYADVGSMGLSASYTGASSSSETGLSMSGSTSFIAAPASFSVVSDTSAAIKAGNTFTATVKALNASNATTPNFGKESTAEGVTMSFAKATPTGSGAVNGSLMTNTVGSFASGVATATLAWSEVGTIDLTATLKSGSYLGTGLTATGTTGTAGAVGPFTPHHFNTVVTQGCSSNFTYSGQPFTTTVTALNASNGTTVNYNGSTSTTSPVYAKAVTLSAASNATSGTLANTSIAASVFGSGIATLATPTFTFGTKLTAEKAVSIRAVDTDSISSSGYTEGVATVRSGRIKVSNAFGSESAALSIPVQAQYWSGSTWVVNSLDSCTSIPSTSVIRTNYLGPTGSSTSSWTSTASAVTMSTGNGTLTLGAPSPTATGSVDFAFNLGSSTTDVSCLSSHPTSVGAAASWLRSQNGSCATTYDRDPSGRATFGVYAPETKKTVYIRELY